MKQKINFRNHIRYQIYNLINNLKIKIICNTQDSLLYYDYERENFFKLLELSKKNIINNIAFLKNEIDYMCGFNYILPGGYFVFQESVYNSGKMKIVKIAPELYVTK